MRIKKLPMKRIAVLCIGFLAFNTHLNSINTTLEDRFAFPVADMWRKSHPRSA